jgi:hypothetical protein
MPVRKHILMTVLFTAIMLLLLAGHIACLYLGIYGLMPPILLYTVCAIFFLELCVGVVLVIRDTRRKQGNWGINLRGVHSCPACGASLPKVRAPTSLRQGLWGGWTCAQCHAEIDKWGQLIPPEVTND